MGRFFFGFLLLIIQLFSCSTGSDNSQNSSNELVVADFDLEKIKERGILRAVFDNNSTNYFIYKGKPMGYEYELLNRYCGEIGVKLEIIVSADIEEAFELLNKGEVDVIAYFLAITQERKKIIGYTNRIISSRQVLVQKKPVNWRKMSVANRSRHLIRNQVDLIGKDVYVRANSSYEARLKHLSEEIGGEINSIPLGENIETEKIIRMVAEDSIDYTVADEDLALVNAAYFPDLDVETPVSFPQQIAWGIRNNAYKLRESLNDYIRKIKRNGFHQIIYNRYFQVNRTLIERAQSDFSSISGNQISKYDDLVKQWSDSIGWDWKLISSMIYQESRFNEDARSWAGARGLMQVMPATGSRFGATNLLLPEQNIMAGCLFLKYLNNYWSDSVKDSVQLKKFVLASYNVGLGHVQDAVNLAEEMGFEETKWDDEVEEAMKMKSNPQYFRMKLVKYGYARGESVAIYVEHIWRRYEEYLLHFGGEMEN